MSVYWVNIYFLLVTSGRKTVNDVPEGIRQQVVDKLVQEGYTINPDGTVTKA